MMKVRKKGIVFEHISLQDAEKPGTLKRILDEIEELEGEGRWITVVGNFKNPLNDLKKLREEIARHHRGEEFGVGEFEDDGVIGYVFETKWEGELSDIEQNKKYTLFYVARGDNTIRMDEESGVVALYRVKLRTS